MRLVVLIQLVNRYRLMFGYVTTGTCFWLIVQAYMPHCKSSGTSYNVPVCNVTNIISYHQFDVYYMLEYTCVVLQSSVIRTYILMFVLIYHDLSLYAHNNDGILCQNSIITLQIFNVYTRSTYIYLILFTFFRVFLLWKITTFGTY